MIKFLIGGSPCTHWSIAKSKNRQTTASGEGWELFRNFVIAKQRFKPDYFLYENNKSAASAIKEQISTELEAPLQYINSALVSAQNRERFYCHNFGDVPMPEDRGIALQDILETGEAWQEKAYCLTATYDGAVAWNTLERKQRSMIAEVVDYTAIPTRIGTIENNAKNQDSHDSKPYRVYSPFGKSVTLQGEAGGMGAKTGLYACPTGPQGRDAPIYRVASGKIEIKGKLYPINLPDGYCIIRKLTVTECCRLQTIPDDYCRVVSNTQAYRGLGNGWTAEVIIHLLAHALRDIPKSEEIIVLSMYDGIGTGRYCFDRLGYNNISYYAYEIDKHAMAISMSNYPDIRQCGDAYAVREAGWFLAG